jgi:hypothetical protein
MLRAAKQFRQFGDIGRNAPRFVTRGCFFLVSK